MLAARRKQLQRKLQQSRNSCEDNSSHSSEFIPLGALNSYGSVLPTTVSMVAWWSRPNPSGHHHLLPNSPESLIHVHTPSSLGLRSRSLDRFGNFDFASARIGAEWATEQKDVRLRPANITHIRVRRGCFRSRFPGPPRWHSQRPRLDSGAASGGVCRSRAWKGSSKTKQKAHSTLLSKKELRGSSRSPVDRVVHPATGLLHAETTPF